MSGSNEISSDGRWEIQWKITKDTNSYFESDTRWEVLVVNTATKKVAQVFIRSEYGGASGWDNSGVSAVHFTPDGSSITAIFEEGPEQTIALPAPDEEEKKLTAKNANKTKP